MLFTMHLPHLGLMTASIRLIAVQQNWFSSLWAHNRPYFPVSLLLVRWGHKTELASRVCVEVTWATWGWGWQESSGHGSSTHFLISAGGDRDEQDRRDGGPGEPNRWIWPVSCYPEPPARRNKKWSFHFVQITKLLLVLMLWKLSYPN